MKTMKIEKHILFADSVIDVKHLDVRESLSYQHEMDGIRAVGSLYIQGEYLAQDETLEPFEEILDMDVLAPNAKLTQEPFYLKVEDFHSAVDQEGLCVYITLSIYGIKEDSVHDQIAIPLASQPEALTPPYSPSIDEEHQVEEVDEAIPPSTDIDEPSEFEDLFEDADTTYTSYRMVVARMQDTYDSIAQRYQVEVERLKEMNHHKEVRVKTLVILPPDSQRDASC